MSIKTFQGIESNLPIENFAKIARIPILIKGDSDVQCQISGEIDFSREYSLLSVDWAKKLELKIIDSIPYTNTKGEVKYLPACKIRLSNESMDGKWVDFKVGITTIDHPNSNIILGQDFKKLFCLVDINSLTKEISLHY